MVPSAVALAGDAEQSIDHHAIARPHHSGRPTSKSAVCCENAARRMAPSEFVEEDLRVVPPPSCAALPMFADQDAKPHAGAAIAILTASAQFQHALPHCVRARMSVGRDRIERLRALSMRRGGSRLAGRPCPAASQSGRFERECATRLNVSASWRALRPRRARGFGLATRSCRTLKSRFVLPPCFPGLQRYQRTQNCAKISS